ncbi:MAG: hypothetical protein Kow00124_05070 [Anaerolineae bacterium]
MILSPTFVFGLMIATLIGALAHLALGGNGRRLAAYTLAAWVGFAIGQTIGSIIGFNTLAIGQLNTLAGVLGALIGVAAAAVLAIRSPAPR